ncbi:MAG: isoleucine--tRNA ligase [Proteobacteria bacterium]|nr:isoleucine--tRNA ligase [Pseudomonadota bacterium]
MAEMSDKKGAAAQGNDYGKTLQLPVTDFAMRANLPAREPGWVAGWLDGKVYERLRERRLEEGAGKYIVHLGPPYANGNFHMGHVLTYVLKDFVVRSKFMGGFDSPYAPGWDCHGLPIEWKVEQDLRAEGKTKRDVSKAELRARCRAYAQKWVDVQKSEWQRFGALGDWDHPYLTMAPGNEAGIVRELGKMVARNLVYKGLRSTLWAPVEETALAEAEVEYDEKHKSTAVYVGLPVKKGSGERGREVAGDNEFLVIWTTTPWTLPANRAVAVKADEEYVGLTGMVNPIEISRQDTESFEKTAAARKLGGTVWVAKALASDFIKQTGFQVSKESSPLKGSQLTDWMYEHPLYVGVMQPVVEGFHVTTDAGTGLVHIAPAHGPEDYQIGKQFDLPLVCPVDGSGKYEAWVEKLPLTGVEIAGKDIWKTQEEIIAELVASGRLLHRAELVHKYPISWRSKKPLIYRTTEQWFIALDGVKIPETGKDLRQSSLDRIYAREGVRGVQWVPEYGANRIGSMIEHRPDWCISRQRAWGVPITVIGDRLSLIGDEKVVRGGIVVDPAVWEHIAGLVEREGIDAWDTRIESGRKEELFPDGWLDKHGVKASDFDYVQDILDVWFDSGTTHAHVLRADSAPGQRFHREDGKRPADLYQEGSDQHRGWFHSSLLTSVANYGDAPYESVVTSGFVVDGEGRKFSKSLGNGVEPGQLLGKYGMDIIRLWVASSDYSEDIRYSPQIMDSMSEAYRRFRNTFRWLLGNLHGFSDDDVKLENLPELESYMLHRLGKVLSEVRGHFDAFQFHKGYRVLYEFCGVELSNFYFDVRKDVLYCDPKDGEVRRACQSVLVKILRGLATHLAPLMPFTTDEVWRERYGESECVHLARFEEVDGNEIDKEFDKRWHFYTTARSRINVELEAQRAKGIFGPNAEADVEVQMDVSRVSKSAGLLDEEEFRTVMGVSRLKVVDSKNEQIVVRATRAVGHKCPRCWRYYGKLEASGVCLRCEEAMNQQGPAR